MDSNIKVIGKNYIFCKVKYITDQLQLQDYEKNQSIGYLFLDIMRKNH